MGVAVKLQIVYLRYGPNIAITSLLLNISETNEGQKVANDLSIAFKTFQIHGAIQPSYQSFTQSSLSS